MVSSIKRTLACNHLFCCRSLHWGWLLHLLSWEFYLQLAWLNSFRHAGRLGTHMGRRGGRAAARRWSLRSLHFVIHVFISFFYIHFLRFLLRLSDSFWFKSAILSNEAIKSLGHFATVWNHNSIVHISYFDKLAREQINALIVCPLEHRPQIQNTLVRINAQGQLLVDDVVGVRHIRIQTIVEHWGSLFFKLLLKRFLLLRRMVKLVHQVLVQLHFILVLLFDLMELH